MCESLLGSCSFWADPALLFAVWSRSSKTMLAVSVETKSGDETEGASYYHTSSICRRTVSVVPRNAHVPSIKAEGLYCVIHILCSVRILRIFLSRYHRLVGVEATEASKVIDEAKSSFGVEPILSEFGIAIPRTTSPKFQSTSGGLKAHLG